MWCHLQYKILSFSKVFLCSYHKYYSLKMPALPYDASEKYLRATSLQNEQQLHLPSTHWQRLQSILGNKGHWLLKRSLVIFLYVAAWLSVLEFYYSQDEDARWHVHVQLLTLGTIIWYICLYKKWFPPTTLLHTTIKKSRLATHKHASCQILS